jgi:hypothetical protein
MAKPVDVEVGEHTQQRRAHIGPSAGSKRSKSIQTEEVLRLHCLLLTQQQRTAVRCQIAPTGPVF